ncbi:MAG: type II toxin-antitoxin system VapC family toxin [Anaerolineales bacterium]|nr:type II toxin-antitoxin system VapC family toxin [Anaerolineales bacterium]MCB9127378.1 type II toxin-antitoxin system VapC family toxin [Ardenticatenales bacterium]MCB9172711.1 type II toxin-antitoxin system VapC family toxin [Ardenticatenales bacterium]
MNYLLDTDSCVEIIRNNRPYLLGRLKEQPLGSVGVSTITVAELSTGVAKSSQPATNRKALARFLLPLQIYSFDEKAAMRYGEVRAALERQGTPIGSMDMLIAAHTLTVGCTLVTHNKRHFEHVEGLLIDDWVDRNE